MLLVAGQDFDVQGRIVDSGRPPCLEIFAKTLMYKGNLRILTGKARYQPHTWVCILCAAKGAEAPAASQEGMRLPAVREKDGHGSGAFFGARIARSLVPMAGHFLCDRSLGRIERLRIVATLEPSFRAAAATIT